MRSTIDIPDEIMKKAKISAVKQGITLKELFIHALEKELESQKNPAPSAPWKKLHQTGSAAQLTPEDSGFDGYSGPDWVYGSSVNEPKG